MLFRSGPPGLVRPGSYVDVLRAGTSARPGHNGADYGAPMGFLRRLLGGDGGGVPGGAAGISGAGGDTGGGRHLTGTARVVACSSYNGDGMFQACTLNLVVQVEGLEPYSTEHHQFCSSRRRRPVPGMICQRPAARPCE